MNEDDRFGLHGARRYCNGPNLQWPEQWPATNGRNPDRRITTMRFLDDGAPPHELTYNDVFMVPSLSGVPSRLDVDLATPDAIGTTLPIVVANMTAVAGKRMAETVARRGALAILPQDIPLDIVERNVRYVKSRHLVYDTAITLGPTDTVQQALSLVYKRAHGAVIVVEEGAPIGIFTEVDAEGFDRFSQLHTVMSSQLVSFRARTPVEDMYEQLTEARLSCAPVVDDGRLVGVITRKGALRAELYRPAVDEAGRLMVGTALGINGDVATKAKTVADFGIDLIV
ncbi:MAG: dehydrogenase, partial [Acidimicrobiaceae bacterium]|nr:dehydrogenase [Acidimicrobiaceae bacterium]